MATEPEDKDLLEVEVSEDGGTTVVEPEIIIEEPVASAEKEPEVLAPEDGIKKLQERLDATEHARRDAERRAAEAAQVAHKARAEAQDSNLHLFTNEIRAIEQRNSALKDSYANALAAQDFNAAAEIQMEMVSNTADLRDLERGKQALETTPRASAPQPYVADPVEAMARSIEQAGSPRSAAWVRQHPEYANNPALTNEMMAAHQLAVARNIAPDTDAYFEVVERTLGLRSDPQSEAPLTRRAAPPAAPVSRNGGAPGTTPNRVTLSAEEREIAEMMKMTPQEYAKQKLAIKRGSRH